MGDETHIHRTVSTSLNRQAIAAPDGSHSYLDRTCGTSRVPQGGTRIHSIGSGQIDGLFGALEGSSSNKRRDLKWHGDMSTCASLRNLQQPRLVFIYGR